MGTRRKARELALQALFQNEFLDSPDAESTIEVFKSSFDVSADIADYLKKLLSGIFSNIEEIDATINSMSDHWTTARMPLVDLNILRIAVFEIKFSDGSVPTKSVINEAIEIAKKYGGSNSSQFINGILDQLQQRT